MKIQPQHRNIIDSISAGGEWVDCLMNLFWAVDKVASGNTYLDDSEKDHIPEYIMAAYQRAEEARQQL